MDAGFPYYMEVTAVTTDDQGQVKATVNHEKGEVVIADSDVASQIRVGNRILVWYNSMFDANEVSGVYITSPVQHKVVMNEDGITINGVTYGTVAQGQEILVPLRAVAEAMGYQVTWVQEHKSVVLTKEGNVMEVAIGSNDYTVTGAQYSGQQPCTLIEGTTYIPWTTLSDSMK